MAQKVPAYRVSYGGYGALGQPLAKPKPVKTTTSQLGGGITPVAAPPAMPRGLTGQIGSGGGGGGGPLTTVRTMTPNQVYEGQILSDPGSVAAEGIFGAKASALAQARADAIRGAVVNSGWTPSFEGGLAGYSSDLTPSALAQAAANPMSQKAQLDLQLSQAKAVSPYELAARGGSRSGAAAINLGNLSRQYDTASYQGVQDLIGKITGAVNTYAGGYNEAQDALAAARREIAQRLASQAGYSETITQTGGDDYGDYGGDYGGGDGGSSDWLPAKGPNQLSPSYPTPAPSRIQVAAKKAIAAIKPGNKPPANLYQILKNSY